MLSDLSIAELRHAIGVFQEREDNIMTEIMRQQKQLSDLRVKCLAHEQELERRTRTIQTEFCLPRVSTS